MEHLTTGQLARLAVTSGVIGIVAGLMNTVVQMVVIGLVAAAAALLAALVALHLSRRANRAQDRIEDLEDRLDSLETPDPAPADAPGPVDIDARPAAVRDEDVLTDDETGLFSESYFRVALDARLAAARRHLRPVAVVIIDVVEGLEAGTPSPTDPTLVADGIRRTVRDADTACRMTDGRFALVLEDTPENGAIWTVERLRRDLSGVGGETSTLWAGVACYPAHAFDTEEILRQAEAALTAAREWRQDRIEVATAP